MNPRRIRPLIGLAAVLTLLLAVLHWSASATADPIPAPPAGAPLPADAKWTSVPGKARKLDLGGPIISAAALSARSRRMADTVSLTLKHLDDKGQLTANAATVLANLDGSLTDRIDVEDGEVTLQLPKGRYLLASVVRTGAADDQLSNLLVQPLLDLQGDTTVDLDARKAKPLEVTIAKASVGSTLAALYFARRLDDGTTIQTDLRADDLSHLSAAQLGPEVPADQLTSSLVSYWAVPGPAGDFADSPVTYSTLDTLHGRFFTGCERVVKPARMARLVAQLHSTAPELVRFKSVTLIAPEMLGGWGNGLLYRKPQAVTEYVEAGARTVAEVQERPEDTNSGGPVTSLYSNTSSTYEAGRRYDLTWNKAVLGPVLQQNSADRYGDQVVTGISMFSDQAGNGAWGDRDTSSTRLFQDGKLIVETDQPGDVGREGLVTPGRSVFRLESHVDRSKLTQRSTQIDAAWTFHSDTASDAGEPLPLWAIRFQPEVGLQNDARPSSVLPFTLAANPGAKVGRPRLPAVQVSWDTGTTWHPAYVVPKSAGRYLARFALPAGVKAVSVRAQATDTAGNSVEQTILDAYALR